MPASGPLAEPDGRFMAAALAEARLAYDHGQCPVGAVLVREGEIVARAGNREREQYDPTAHAEILVLRLAGQALKRHKFPDCTVYTTLAPCPMCENALLQAEVPRVVFGAGSFRWIAEVRFAPSKLERIGPVFEPECRALFIRWLEETGRRDILDAEGL
jgi:tRNA(Arg) A34 adenosine deaminase TadA